MLFKKNSIHLFIIITLLISCFHNASASPETIDIIDYVIENKSIIAPLGGLTGAPGSGRALVRNQNKGNCLSCHQLPIPEDDFHGNIGPSLYTVGLRFNAAQLRIRMADMKLINPLTIMPGYYRSPDSINRIAPQYEGSTILSAQEIEDIVSYLMTLKKESSTNSQRPPAKPEA
ncbi:MAG: sulfur oxidation c-type cytochrome SoxX [gamma proteobacterium symbiont of Lucinoma myriamae]|nr:sulfur oxidation c-type cytochrome SoxX [gamma proteobacterium symbiont of Lucinoma myriamae]MCU7819005.1 sulfur oxidation c-type cytochrome SoxX [gamma proteobacterium symbiont of Lucinoma myriamae]MCU7831785.1 sulfur oxidation c-type cytochrome SoxX [gamma proteobacterium symbiont of Lucinoma myriamae]